jgi:hypothetical protein
LKKKRSNEECTTEGENKESKDHGRRESDRQIDRKISGKLREPVFIMYRCRIIQHYGVAEIISKVDLVKEIKKKLASLPPTSQFISSHG